MKKNLFLSLCLFVLGLCVSSCSSEEDVLPPKATDSKEMTMPFDIKKSEKADYVKELFVNHTTLSRGFSSEDVNLEEYDFSLAVKMDVKEKNENVYVIPSKNNEGDFISGIEINGCITYIFKLKKSKDNIIVLYNELDEPMFDFTYYDSKQQLAVTKEYGNNAIAFPETRVDWGSAACNVGLGTAMAVSAALAAPTLGASVGMVFCGYVITSLIC